MKIAICDDESRCLEQALVIAHDYAAQRKDKNISFLSFSHAEDLLEAAEKNGGFDVYILDVVMPGINGIRLGIKLRDLGYDGKIIYLSSSEEYALDSFKAKAFHYMIKPCQKDEFFQIVDEAIAAIAVKKDRSTVVKTKDRIVKLHFNQIVCIELVKRIAVYHLTDGKTVESISLRTNFPDAVADLLLDRRFTLCGAGLLVNMDHITEIGTEQIVFGDSHRAFLGKKACRDLRSAWNDFLFGEEE